MSAIGQIPIAPSVTAPIPLGAVTATSLASLTLDQQASIVRGTIVVTATQSFVYTGYGSKTSSASYVGLVSSLNTKQEFYYSEVFYTETAGGYSMPPDSTISDSAGPIERLILFTFSGVHTLPTTYFNFPATGNAGDMVTVTNSLQKADGSLNTRQLVVREVDGAISNVFDNIAAGQSLSYIRKTSATGIGKWDHVGTTAHSHGNITNAGAVGTTANLPLITTTSGAVTTGTFGTTTNSFCQGNDTRLDRSAFIATWDAGATPGYRNMADNTLELINFNTPNFNTDASNYSLELGNANNAIDGKIRIGKNGTYLVNLIYNTYDISPGAYYSFYIFLNSTSKSTASYHSVTLFDQAPAGGSVATGARYLFGGMTGIVVVLNAPLWVSLVFRPTAGNPYPTDGTSGSYTQPPRVEIIKVT